MIATVGLLAFICILICEQVGPSWAHQWNAGTARCRTASVKITLD